MCVCLWFSVLLYVYVVVSVSVPIKRKRLYESPRAVTRLTVYRPRRVSFGARATDGQVDHIWPFSTKTLEKIGFLETSRDILIYSHPG